MKANQLATLVLRLLGIYCLIVLIPMAEVLSGVIFYAQSTSGGMGTALVFIAVLLAVSWLAVGISLIVFSKPLGEMLTPADAAEGNITAFTFEQIQMLAFAVAGVLIFAESLPQLTRDVFAFFHYLVQLRERNPFPDGWPYNRFGFPTFIGTLLKTMLGLWLFFGARGFANFWRSMRNFATPKPPGN